MASQNALFDGLRWSRGNAGSLPRWTVEPRIDAIQKTVESLRPNSKVEVTFLAEGCFNKVYNTKVDDEELIMRVSLPVDPHYKVNSEVATMNWVRQTTDIPLPVVLAYDSSQNNNIGFEWILMTKMPGKPLAKMWASLSPIQKSRLVKNIAGYFACLFQHQLRGIGNIHRTPIGAENATSSEQTTPLCHSSKLGETDSSDTPEDKSTTNPVPDVDRIVSMNFIWSSKVHRDVNRGPFHSAHDWIQALLDLNEHACWTTLANAPNSFLEEYDEDEIYRATKAQEAIQMLRPLIPEIFPPRDPSDDPEPSVMLHKDLHWCNILLNDDGEISAILDWEFVSAVPLWRACNHPLLLQCPEYYDQPSVEDYAQDEDGKVEELYWVHLARYESTLLRKIFLEEMEKLEPKWVEIHNSTQLQREFLYAMIDCQPDRYVDEIGEWVEKLTKEREGGSVGISSDMVDEQREAS
ncbi:hypothetical protein N7457_004933 [Penicillium paradoxum]|uniref:uncharacterized protein n=1 Tax=Penicillium paradoxum TaxID=176176 RepID=UPI002547F984|nr:uncharacterized protein N7457_004933 [Penicillium paradoxum]KAJ5783159.1 hypothetical protein N7457_004933 [Penicillium paradoxum]